MSGAGSPRTALVTGASRGIGLGIATELAGQGFALTVTARTEETLARVADDLLAAGAPEVVVHAADLSDREAPHELVRAHSARFASMHALVLSGGVGTAGPVAEMPDRRLDKTLDVNFRASFGLVRAALPLLRAGAVAEPARGARIVALSSIAGVFAEPGLAAYGASKAALASLMQTVNAEESGQGVMATAIAPGYVDTDMSAWTADTVPPASMITVDDVVGVVRMLIGLSANTSITQVVMSRSGTLGYGA